MATFLETHSGEVTILILILMVLATLMVVMPQLLRAHLRKVELRHQEHMKALELGQSLPVDDDRSRMATRLALLVPMVVMIAAGTVTSFIVVKGSQDVFTVSLAIWVVAGVVSLAAITGGLALLGRLANLESEAEEEELPEDAFPH
jgi:ribose/xylose/arabinose/galactoside ABC-type transport system permease subunit